MKKKCRFTQKVLQNVFEHNNIKVRYVPDWHEMKFGKVFVVSNIKVYQKD